MRWQLSLSLSISWNISELNCLCCLVCAASDKTLSPWQTPRINIHECHSGWSWMPIDVITMTNTLTEKLPIQQFSNRTIIMGWGAVLLKLTSLTDAHLIWEITAFFNMIFMLYHWLWYQTKTSLQVKSLKLLFNNWKTA